MTQPQQPPPMPPLPLDYQTGVACPKCGNPHSKPVQFTWWGGLLGPRMFSHVKCLGCGYAYNGKTGRSNAIPIAIYTTISLIAILVIFFFFVTR